MTAKARVTPVSCITTPKSELNGLVVLARLMSTTMKCMPEKAKRITIIGDSECTISALDSTTASLAPYFANRICEVEDAFKSWGSLLLEMSAKDECLQDAFEEGETMIDSVYHTPGSINPADLPTRDQVKVEDIMIGSLWQEGPDYLKRNRSSWPISRQFLDKVPTEERRSKYYARINLAFAKRKLPVLQGSINRMYNILEYSDSIQLVRGILARFIKANMVRDKQAIYKSLCV